MSNKQSASTFLGIAAGLVLVSSSYAAIINVGPGDSIQAAIDVALDGDEIVVAPGTYFETIDLLGKAITLRSSDGPEVTIIDAGLPPGGFGTVVTCCSGEEPDTVLKGFTITGGNAGSGGGMSTNASPTVIGCVFTGNSAINGGGMATFGAIPLGHLGPPPTVINCTFTGNAAILSGGAMLNLGNNPPTIINCTFSGNSVTSKFGIGGGIVNCFSNPTVVNSILWGNTSPQILDAVKSETTVLYTDIQGGWPGVGNIDADPLFVDPLNGDYRLLPGSPCIDAGDNTAVPLDITTDLDGNPRFVDDPDTPDTGLGVPPIVDMGAFELQVDDDDESDDSSSSDSSSSDSQSDDSGSDDSSSGDSSDDSDDESSD